jgi:hypothetical protein
MIPAQLVTLFGRNDRNGMDGSHVPVYSSNGELLGFLPWVTIARGALKIGGGIFKGIKKAVERKRAERSQKSAAAAQQNTIRIQEQQQAIIKQSKNKNLVLIGGGAAALVAVMMVMKKGR